MLKKKSSIIVYAISMAITVIGSLGVGVALMFSEILYPEIEDLSACPLWYRVFLWVSLGVAVIGTAFCGIFGKTNRAKQMLFYKKEQKIEIVLLLVGFWLMVVAAFRKENRVGDMAICFGGALCSLGLFTFLGTSIGLSRSMKKSKYIDLTSQFIKKNPLIKFNEPAETVDLLAFESEIECMLPIELLEYYKETDGDGDLMFSVAEAAETTKLVRENFAEFNENVKNIICFGGNGAGDYYCYLVVDGAVQIGEIYTFYHETNELTLSADNLIQLISAYYNGYLY